MFVFILKQAKFIATILLGGLRSDMHFTARISHSSLLSNSLHVFVQINGVDTLGQTALHRAALAGHLQTCRLLLSYGADPAVVSLQGFTAAQMGNEAVQQILNGMV